MIKRYQPYILRQHHCHDSAEMCQHDKGEFTLVSDHEALQKQCDIYRERLEFMARRMPDDYPIKAVRCAAQTALKRGEEK